MSARKPRKDGKVIKQVDLRVAGTRVRVPLRLRTKHDRYSGKDSFEYAIDIDDPAEVRVHHDDPNEVCKLAVAELEKVLSIDWKPWFLVQVSGLEYGYYDKHAKRAQHKAELEIEFAEYELGVRAGVPVYRTPYEGGGGYSHVQEGSPVESRDNKVGISCALVPATDVTRAKLEALVSALHDMRDRIAELLRPDTVEKTLSDMRVLALPMPKDVAIAVEPKRDNKVKARSKR